MSIKSHSCILSILFALGLTACNQTTPTDNAPVKADGQAGVFVGCYSVEKNSPAQIKVSEQAGGFVMQMKEPDGAKTLWDSPEPLDEISVDEAWDYFGVNALSLDKSDVERVLARPDEMMVLAKIKDASQNINPLLDSPYVVYIFKGANTIYQVPCDDTPVDIVKDGEKKVQAFYQ
ncbi:Uncharacterised protein [Moraxella lacunata]|uniref:Lipoprotein n=1 Tax=Moraxella lacunata TaxID=477 RepID=A0A378T6K7_MORLA|nr:hypothetical protein [Moraxella lacunata]STZ55505.1 Uncharacterised protein [Moraxella lacunata]